MPYQLWHQEVIKKVSPVSEFQLYVRVLVTGTVIFALAYAYLVWQKVPNSLNKAVADTSIILIGLSMLLSSLCYFWDFVDTKIIYRKHLGLMGFAFGLVHVGLSFSALKRLIDPKVWFTPAFWPVFVAAIATVIFTVMAAVSNQFSATKLGGRTWRNVLRTGYVALWLIWLHVYLLKSGRWVMWYMAGMSTPPALSLLVTIFMTVVIVMRVALWWSLKKKQKLMEINAQ